MANLPVCLARVLKLKGLSIHQQKYFWRGEDVQFYDGRMPVTAENQEVSEGENLADTLAAIESSLKKLIKSGLNMDAIIILLAEHSKVRRGDVRTVLESLPELRKRYTTK